MRYAYKTDPGKVRDHNEDNVIIVENETGEILMAVADGMGGHLCGEVASSIAITHIAESFKKISSNGITLLYDINFGLVVIIILKSFNCFL